MADMKQYELVFMLKAQLDASMQQFSVVGGHLHELEEKLQQYNNTLKTVDAYQRQETAIAQYEEKLRRQEAALLDVTRRFSAATAAVKIAEQAYKQHQTAVDGLNIRIAEEKARLAEINSALKQDGADTKALNQEKAACQERIAALNLELKKEQQALRDSGQRLKENRQAEKELQEEKNQSQKTLDGLRQKLGEERQRLQELSEALKKAGVDTRDLDAAAASLEKQIKETAGEQERWAKLGNGVNDLANQFMVLKMAADAAGKAVGAVNDFVFSSIETAGKLQYTISAVEAVSGAAAEQTAKLAAISKEMGATTVYTAQECAEALQTEALAGWSVEQMLSGLPSVIKLAAAAGEDLAETTGIVVDGLNAFQMTGERAAVKFADVLAKAATSSNTNVALLGESLSAVETTAGNLGYTIEDVSIALAAMANNSLKGSVSGTALNTALTRMSGANSNAEKAMERLGLSMYDTATGSAKPLLQFLNELRGAFQDFGDDAQSAQIAAYQLAGQRGMRGLLAIVNQSEEQWARLTADVYDYAGAADTISTIRLDNYAGEVKLLEDAWENLQITLGDLFLPTAEDAAGALRGLVNGADEFIQNNGPFVKGLVTATVTAGGLFAAVSAVATGIQMIRYAMTTLKVGQLLNVVGGFGGAAGIAVGVGLLAAAVTSASEAVSEYTDVLDRHRAAEKAYRDSVAAIDDEAEATSALIAQLRELSGQSEKTGADQEKIANIVDRLNASIPELNLSYDRETDTLKGLSGGVDEYVRSLYEAKKAEEDIARSVELYGSIQDTEKAAEEAKAKFAELWASMPMYMSGNNLFGAAEFAAYAFTAKDLIELLEDEKTEYAELKESTEGYYAAQEKVNEAAEDGIGVFERTETAAQRLAEAYAEAYEEAYRTFSGLFDLYDKAEKKYTTMADLQGALDSQISYFSEYTDNLQALKAAAEEYGVDISGVWGRLSDGSTESAAAVAALLGSVKGGDAAALERYAAAYAELEEKLDALSDFVIKEKVVEEIEQAEKDIVEAVRETGAYDAAMAAMDETFDGYLESIKNGTGEVERALARAAERWKTAISGSLLSAVPGLALTPGTAGNWGFQSLGDYLNGYGAESGPTTDTGFYGISGKFASGTDNAPPGWGLVGENGPELMYFHGGERVIPAPETARLLSAAEERYRENYYGGAAVSFPGVSDDALTAARESGGDVQIVFQINGDVTERTMENLRDYGDEFAEKVRRVIREERAATRRRSFVS